MRVVYRVRCTVTGLWKLTYDAYGSHNKPIDFDTREAAILAARYVKRWRIVKVTIRP